MLTRSMWTQSPALAMNDSSAVMTVPTNVGPIRRSISACGHSTTLTNGNMYSFNATSRSGLSA